MKAKEKANEIANNNCSHVGCTHGEHYFDSTSDCYKSTMQMYQWAQDEFMQKAENAFCNQCKKNPCRNKIAHGSLCYEGELFLKSILKEL